MLIGNRWQPGTANSETLCRVAGKYMDVISINYYTCGIDRAFVRRLYEWTGRKPQMWSEFYFTATKRATSRPATRIWPRSARAASLYRNYVEGAAALGFVVGVGVVSPSSTSRDRPLFRGPQRRARQHRALQCRRPPLP
jgi:hypothetical protein